MKRVAVVILNYNGAPMLEKFLPSVVAFSPEAEVIVADNASSDASLEFLRANYPALRTISLDKNYGFAEGYNKALAQVDSEYYILLNSDVEVAAGWIAPMLSFMDGNAAAVACQPKLLDYKNRECFEYAGAAGGFIDRYGYPYCRGRLFGTVEKDCGQYNDIYRVFWTTGAAMMVRSKDYWAAGGLDGNFFAHMEEVDFCWRLQSRGGELYCVPESVVYHVGGATLDKSNPRKTFLNFRNNLLMLYKNLPEQELRSVMRTRSVLDYVAALKFLLSGSIGDFKAVIKARKEYKRMRGSYKAVREENLLHTVVGKPYGRAPFMLLWQYYVRGKKHFNELKE
ncbi:MAG: glycosyltransferase family 2 protein [Bacteroidaceae bacterium]|nr:glycosyltransferase family 2 protein [Bacteroidaceae bacterium]